jgi:hypothetical protein
MKEMEDLESGLRIGSELDPDSIGSVDSDPDPIRNLDPDPGGQKFPHKSIKKLKISCF